MVISPTYTNRTDLSRWDKIRYSFEEKVENALWARQVCRLYLQLPKCLQGTLEMAAFLIPVIVLGIFDHTAKFLICDDEPSSSILGGLLCATVLGAITYFTPLGWIMIGWMAIFFVGFWFSEIMRDHRKSLER
jgi:hypothetical protein